MMPITSFTPSSFSEGARGYWLDERRVMLITTANDLPGYEIRETLGEVFGLTVRSRNVGSQLGASLKSLVGGELKGLTRALTDSREQVIERMVAAAEEK